MIADDLCCCWLLFIDIVSPPPPPLLPDVSVVDVVVKLTLFDDNILWFDDRFLLLLLNEFANDEFDDTDEAPDNDGPDFDDGMFYC